MVDYLRRWSNCVCGVSGAIAIRSGCSVRSTETVWRPAQGCERMDDILFRSVRASWRASTVLRLPNESRQRQDCHRRLSGVQIPIAPRDSFQRTAFFWITSTANLVAHGHLDGASSSVSRVAVPGPPRFEPRVDTCEQCGSTRGRSGAGTARTRQSRSAILGATAAKPSRRFL